MIILDPDVSGCTVVNGLKATYIKGNPCEVVHEIILRTCYGITHWGKPRQIIPIAIISGGIGDALIHALEYYGLEITKIKAQQLYLVLPIIES